MTGAGSAMTLIQGRCVHKASNALKITFQDGPDDSCAVGVQGANDSKGKKFATLLGFKNGGTGNHLLTLADGTTVQVSSRDSAPTVLTRGDGVELATVQRGATSTAVRAGGGEILHFVPDPEEARTPDLFRIVVTDPGGTTVGRLDIVRRVSGWSLARTLDAAYETYVWWDRAGQALPIPILGTRFIGDRPLTEEERLIVLSVCVDIAIGLRPYIAEMG